MHLTYAEVSIESPHLHIVVSDVFVALRFRIVPVAKTRPKAHIERQYCKARLVPFNHIDLTEPLRKLPRDHRIFVLCHKRGYERKMRIAVRAERSENCQFFAFFKRFEIIRIYLVKHNYSSLSSCVAPVTNTLSSPSQSAIFSSSSILFLVINFVFL